MGYQVFISYRRDGGVTTAKLLQEKLMNMGYTVFFDIDSLRNGKFDEKIYDAIESCNDFLLILSPNALDRCKNDGDWVRTEIAHALKHNKNIIPVMLPEFDMPKSLPSDINELLSRNGLKFEITYLDAVMQKLTEDWMTSRPRSITAPPKHQVRSTTATTRHAIPSKPILIATASVILVALSVFIFSLTRIGKQLFCSHSYVTATTEPTCDDNGYTTYTCPKCNKTKTDDYTMALGHVFGESTVLQASTCTENGTQYKECLVCQFHEQTPILAVGHSYSEWVVDKEATSTQNGARHAVCTVCNERVDEVVYTAGSAALKYERDGDHYVLKGIGGCREKNIVIASVVDGYPVTEIADNAFEKCDIESVIIPEGITKIGKKAFQRCSDLKTVDMPKSLESIGKYAFAFCTSLESVTIPENVTELGNQAFRMCSGLNTVTLSKSIKRIGTGCFTDCWKLKEIYYDNTEDAWDDVKTGWFAFNTARSLWGSSTIVYCRDAAIKV